MLVSFETVTSGKGITPTVICAVSRQPFMIPVIVYVVVFSGPASTTEPVSADNPVCGCHSKSVAPCACMLTELPLQTCVSGSVDTTGRGRTWTWMPVLLLHWFDVRLLYKFVMLMAKQNHTSDVVSNPFDGDQTYWSAPVAMQNCTRALQNIYVLTWIQNR